MANSKQQSRWREFAFMFHQVQRAIEPASSLSETLGHWNEIAQSLAESPRQRSNQVERYFDQA